MVVVVLPIMFVIMVAVFMGALTLMRRASERAENYLAQMNLDPHQPQDHQDGDDAQQNGQPARKH